MKTCTKCVEYKPLQDYNRDSRASDGRKSHCKSCQSLMDKRYKSENCEYISKMRRQYRQDNMDKIGSAAAYRRAYKAQRTVPWSNKRAITSIYREAQRLTKVTGIQFHVDHIYPLKGKSVSGLHTEDNLQILTCHDNMTKHNRHPDA